MENYIIDPSVFYWLNVLDAAHTISIVFLVFSIITLITALIFYIYNKTEFIYYEKDDYKKYMKIALKAAIPACICTVIFVLLTLFVPNKQTSAQMLVARVATFDNVNWTVDQVKELVDYIVKAIQGAV